MSKKDWAIHQRDCKARLARIKRVAALRESRPKTPHDEGDTISLLRSMHSESREQRHERRNAIPLPLAVVGKRRAVDTGVDGVVIGRGSDDTTHLNVAPGAACAATTGVRRD